MHVLTSFTILHGQPAGRPDLSGVSQPLACYAANDDRLVVVLPGRQTAAAAQWREVWGLADPVVVICDHYCTITAVSDRLPFDSGAGATGYQAWIGLTTDAARQRPLADLNVVETASLIRHLPGFRSASFFLQEGQPVVHEHVVWESERHFLAALEHPEFVRHSQRATESATAAWSPLRRLTQ